MPTDGSVLVIGRIRIEDPATWPTYRDAVPATLAPFGGTVVARGHDAFALAGSSPETDMVVLRFPSREAALGWYRSAAYQALIPMRDASADVVIVGYEV